MLGSKKEKGVEDFLYVLVAAIVIMVVFALISPLVPTGGVPGEFTAIEEFEMGSVGFIEEVPAKSITLGSFTVGMAQSQVLRSFDRMEVQASMFGQQGQKYTITVPEWYRELMDKVRIDFRVDSTNMYGDLIIKWNGKTVYQDKAHPRTYHIEVDRSYVENTNSLDVYCAGPGVMFWASTVYRLKDFKVNVEYGPIKLVPFEIFQNELQTFQRGEVSFYAVGDARLNIKVNGVDIYNQVPIGADTAEFQFTDVPLKMGDNIISFSTAGGPVQMFDTKLKVYLLTNEITRQRVFNVTDEQYTSLQQVTGKGRVEYVINNIAREGSMKIKLNGNDLAVPVPVVGTNIVYFSSDQAQEGLNTIDFSATGSFEVSTVKVGIEKV